MPVTIRKRRVLERNVYDLAVERMEQAFAKFDHISVSFSGGKDSTVCLHVALDAARKAGRLPLDVVFLDEECIPYETEEYVRRVAQNPEIKLTWLALPVKHRNSCSTDSPFWYPWDSDCPEKWARPLPPEAVTEWPGFSKGIAWQDTAPLLYAKTLGSVGQVLGLRAQESLARQRLLTQTRKGHNWIVQFQLSIVEDGRVPRGLCAHLWKVYPIYDWTTTDIWTAPAKFGWDYNRAYDLMEMAGLPAHHQRCAPPFGDEPMQKLWTFKHCFPDVWERMVYRVPGAATAARYAHTGLYAFGEWPDLPPGLTWPQFVNALLARRTEEKSRKVIALRIRKNIGTHVKKTTDPILDVEHPVTGISWPFLAMIAKRGDIYQRKIPHLGVWGQDKRRDEAYMEAMERWRRDPTPFQTDRA